MKRRLGVLMMVMIFAVSALNAKDNPVKLAIIGLTHSHVHGILGRADTGDVKIVGIVEPNRELAGRYAEMYGFSLNIVYDTMDEMLDKVQPEAVAAFGDIYDHLKVVEECAPRGIHVMVEKPLAVSMEHARKMRDLAVKHNIHLITNYETTWYATNQKAEELLKEGKIGGLRKVIVRDGHKGPKKIGVNPEFLEWLTDPVRNGGGAITDFGCYGANLLTWIHNGKKPSSVTAVTQQQQAENNPKVDDDAIIILKYEGSNAIIQASWDWPIGRKDMEIYGEKGAIYADNSHDLRLRISEGYDGFEETAYKLEKREPPFNDPFTMFAALVRKKITLKPYDLSSLENNMIVVEILDAAKKSAETATTVFIND